MFWVCSTKYKDFFVLPCRHDQHTRLMCDDYILHFMAFHIIKLLDPGWFVRLVDNITFSPHCSRLMIYSVITKSNVIPPVNVLLFVSGSDFDSNYLITVGTRGNRIQYSTYLTHQWRHELWSCGDWIAISNKQETISDCKCMDSVSISCRLRSWDH